MIDPAFVPPDERETVRIFVLDLPKLRALTQIEVTRR